MGLSGGDPEEFGGAAAAGTQAGFQDFRRVALLECGAQLGI